MRVAIVIACLIAGVAAVSQSVIKGSNINVVADMTNEFAYTVTSADNAGNTGTIHFRATWWNASADTWALRLSNAGGSSGYPYFMNVTNVAAGRKRVLSLTPKVLSTISTDTVVRFWVSSYGAVSNDTMLTIEVLTSGVVVPFSDLGVNGSAGAIKYDSVPCCGKAISGSTIRTQRVEHTYLNVKVEKAGSAPLASAYLHNSGGFFDETKQFQTGATSLEVETCISKSDCTIVAGSYYVDITTTDTAGDDNGMATSFSFDITQIGAAASLRVSFAALAAVLLAFFARF